MKGGYKCLHVVFTVLESTNLVVFVIEGSVNLNMIENILDHISETSSNNRLHISCTTWMHIGMYICTCVHAHIYVIKLQLI